jgi:hypothetical protein
LVLLLSQLSYPALQDEIWQVPVEHVAVAFALLHATLQSPQSVSVLIALSHPLAGLESQLLYRPLQTGLQTPAEQWLLDTFTCWHTVPQLPQLLSSVWRLRQYPLQQFPL